ncbi:hypothetical protein C2845_PM15G04940 [Panicum miliaceum]|uniref:Uncharacterized protein n=1 Tax=Panicum miliaceum TaxID=4540 RepID=A0A3L6Q6N5_PANMI|nr:hypothetical protein C2845_PM15G04940 [Panicum miliaceum]
MEIGLAMAAFDAAMEGESSPSRSSSSSGCQSGWTLYLEHSNGARCDPAAQQRWMLLQAECAGGGEHEEEEDSMASDASSGPRPRPRELEADAARRDFELSHRGFVVDLQRSYYSTTSGAGHRSSSTSGSGRSLGSSTWSRSSQGVGKGGVARRTAAAAVFQGGDATVTRQYREAIVIDDDDEEEELDDTASSSVVFSCPMAMVQAR